jgi:hypothetical protein
MISKPQAFRAIAAATKARPAVSDEPSRRAGAERSVSRTLAAILR